jgi:hypothetical protein
MVCASLDAEAVYSRRGSISMVLHLNARNFMGSSIIPKYMITSLKVAISKILSPSQFRFF